MRTVLILIAVLALAGCPKRERSLPASTTETAVEATVAPAPGETAVSEAVGGASAAAEALAEQIVPEAPPPPPVTPLVAAPAADLIARWEIGSVKQYNRLYKRPVWPKGASGITWCIGYDGGHQTARVIADDWASHPEVAALRRTAGVRGQAAAAALPQFRYIITEYPYCLEIFSGRSLIEYERRTRRTFGDGYDLLRPLAKGALVSLVYNRGGSLVGESRREMKTIADDCVPRADYACIAREFRSMKRLWKGTRIEAGMYARREAEAMLVEQE